MTNPKHTDTSYIDQLVKQLRGDCPEILVEKDWMLDSDAVDKQRAEAADCIEFLVAEIKRLREELAAAYIKPSGKSIHTDPPGDADLVAKLRDEDSYYRVQEKHWCIDAEELERQRLAAADCIESLKAKVEGLRDTLQRIRDTGDAALEPEWVKRIARAALGEKQ